MNDILEEKKKGEFAIQQRKKKREIIEEGHHQVNIPPDVSDEEKKAMEQTGDDATSGWWRNNFPTCHLIRKMEATIVSGLSGIFLILHKTWVKCFKIVKMMSWYFKANLFSNFKYINLRLVRRGLIEDNIIEIGNIAHFFPKISVAVLDLTLPMTAGDLILIKGPNTDFEQIVESMQIDRAPIERAEGGQSIGLRVTLPVREKDVVYKKL